VIILLKVRFSHLVKKKAKYMLLVRAITEMKRSRKSENEMMNQTNRQIGLKRREGLGMWLVMEHMLTGCTRAWA
jgi:hypothetical protein